MRRVSLILLLVFGGCAGGPTAQDARPVILHAPGEAFSEAPRPGEELASREWWPNETRAYSNAIDVEQARPINRVKAATANAVRYPLLYGAAFCYFFTPMGLFMNPPP